MQGPPGAAGDGGVAEPGGEDVGRRARMGARRRWIALPLAVVCALGLVAWLRYSPRDAVAAEALHALEVGDADKLVALAAPGEVRWVGLSPATVRAFLRHTAWRGGPPGPLAAQRVVDAPEDIGRYRVTPAYGLKSGWLGYWDVYVCQEQATGRWRLRLSATMMCSTYARPEPGSPTDSWIAAWLIGRPLGMKGVANIENQWIEWGSPSWRRYVIGKGFSPDTGAPARGA